MSKLTTNEGYRLCQDVRNFPYTLCTFDAKDGASTRLRQKNDEQHMLLGSSYSVFGESDRRRFGESLEYCYTKTMDNGTFGTISLRPVEKTKADSILVWYLKMNRRKCESYAFFKFKNEGSCQDGISVLLTFYAWAKKTEKAAKIYCGSSTTINCVVTEVSHSQLKCLQALGFMGNSRKMEIGLNRLLATMTSAIHAIPKRAVVDEPSVATEEVKMEEPKPRDLSSATMELALLKANTEFYDLDMNQKRKISLVLEKKMKKFEEAKGETMTTEQMNEIITKQIRRMKKRDSKTKLESKAKKDKKRDSKTKPESKAKKKRRRTSGSFKSFNDL